MRWLISLCTLAILLVHGIEANGDEAPLTKLGAKTGPTLRFAYCYSCGYRKVFEQYASILKEKYPELHVEGQNFNPPGYNMFVAKSLGMLKILIIILIVSGFDFGRPLPSVWQWCIDNRFYACILIFLICNAIEGQLISSGAFEIHFNGKHDSYLVLLTEIRLGSSDGAQTARSRPCVSDVPVWSKLETGRIPQPPELFQIIDFHLDMMFSEADVGKISFNK
ncbi:hypothetical protein DMN91_010119 [Ooceraea biroi]|uniref:SelT-like protein n=1 Tax=Ooceraea biroi TaxID=2015173 RepID=A0A3L8DBJ3_OOCBI|nr:hypothetical protein DMN91_010119 [Ooceraea biroi]